MCTGGSEWKAVDIRGKPAQEDRPQMKNSPKNEEIILDATLERAVECATFQVRLENGHRLVAFTTPKKNLQELDLQPGDTVKVKFSPYDMSKAVILEDPFKEICS
jgi:translation initiation factor IF-1